MNNSESGRKINQAVNTTSKAVGGALSQAKGALSNWWSSMTTPPIIPNTSPKFPSQNDEPPSLNSKSGNIDESAVDDDQDTAGNCKISIVVSEEHDNHLNEQRNTPVKRSTDNSQEHTDLEGIVEIGREAKVLDTTSDKPKVINI